MSGPEDENNYGLYAVVIVVGNCCIVIANGCEAITLGAVLCVNTAVHDARHINVVG